MKIFPCICIHDANNRLITETKNDNYGGADVSTYTYDGNGNLLSKLTLAANGTTSSETYSYNGLNQLVSATINGKTAYYTYNGQGIRTTKEVDGIVTSYYLDGGNVAAEETGGETTTYLRGLHLFRRQNSKETEYYFFNAHGDVVNTIGTDKKVTHAYYYDAFGEEKGMDKQDTNPFRYCGEYWDTETGTYYLRARYYAPNIGRFTQADTHWNTANMIYGDNPQKINEREDRLGLKSYSYTPQILAVMQSGNLYLYGINNPIIYVDHTGDFINMCVSAFVGAIVGGINAAVNGDNVLAGIGIGAVSGAISGFAVDFAVATGGAGAIVIAAAGGAIASSGSYIANEVVNHREVNIKKAFIEAGIGSVSNVLSFGVSGGSLKKVGGNVWKNMKENSIKTVMDRTTKTIKPSALNKGKKVLGKKAGKLIVYKTTKTVVKNMAKNLTHEVAVTTVISTNAVLMSKHIELTV